MAQFLESREHLSVLAPSWLPSGLDKDTILPLCVRFSFKKQTNAALRHLVTFKSAKTVHRGIQHLLRSTSKTPSCSPDAIVPNLRHLPTV